MMNAGESVRATEHYLEVIERLNPKLNAILTVTADQRCNKRRRPIRQPPRAIGWASCTGCR